MASPDCGHPLSPRAGSIEQLSNWLCDIDRGKWVSTSHWDTTPAVRRRLADELNREVAAVPPEHCLSCGCPVTQHRPETARVLMGSGR